MTWIRLESLTDNNALNKLVAGIKGHRSPEQAFEAEVEQQPEFELEVAISGDAKDFPRIFSKVQKLLRKTSGDVKLIVKYYRTGSIILTIGCSEKAYTTLSDLFRAGELTSLAGSEIQGIRLKGHREDPMVAKGELRRKGVLSAEVAEPSQEPSHSHQVRKLTGPFSQIEAFVSVIPRLARVADDILKRSTKGLPSGAAQILWILHACNRKDANGKICLTTSQLVQKAQKWLLIPRKAAATTVANAKGELFAKDLIYEAGRPRRVYLSPKGDDFVQQMRRKAAKRVRGILKDLTAEEKEVLYSLVQNLFPILQSSKPQPSKRDPGREPGSPALDEQHRMA